MLIDCHGAAEVSVFEQSTDTGEGPPRRAVSGWSGLT